MKIIRGFSNIPKQLTQCAITMGNFDGVHKGHQCLIQYLKKVGDANKLPTVLMLFEPQPNEFFNRQNAPSRLTTFKEKLTQIKNFAIDYVLVVSFNNKMANCNAKDFIEKLLIQKLDAQYIIIGDDFRFGTNRLGGQELLSQYAAKNHFKFDEISTIEINKKRVSSTSIREALKNNNFTLAKILLGRSYTIKGMVIHGNKLARQLGFPTANIHLQRQSPALHGVYFVKVHNHCTNENHTGIANIGLRPTVNGKHAVLEVNIFNFNQDIYGHQLEVEFIEKIREEIKFSSIEMLKNQIQKDIELAHQINEKLMTTF